MVGLPVGFQRLRLVHADVSIAEQTAHTFRKVLVIGAFDDFKTIFLHKEARKFGAVFDLRHIMTMLLT